MVYLVTNTFGTASWMYASFTDGRPYPGADHPTDCRGALSGELVFWPEATLSELQAGALDRHACRRPFRGAGTAQAVRRRRPRLREDGEDSLGERVAGCGKTFTRRFAPPLPAGARGRRAAEGEGASYPALGRAWNSVLPSTSYRICSAMLVSRSPTRSKDLATDSSFAPTRTTNGSFSIIVSMSAEALS